MNGIRMVKLERFVLKNQSGFLAASASAADRLPGQVVAEDEGTMPELLRATVDRCFRGQNFVFGMIVSTHAKGIGHIVSTGRIRHIERVGGKVGTQPYDHESAQHESHNLADKPVQADHTARLKARLAAHLKGSEPKNP